MNYIEKVCSIFSMLKVASSPVPDVPIVSDVPVVGEKVECLMNGYAVCFVTDMSASALRARVAGVQKENLVTRQKHLVGQRKEDIVKRRHAVDGAQSDIVCQRQMRPVGGEGVIKRHVTGAVAVDDNAKGRDQWCIGDVGAS